MTKTRERIDEAEFIFDRLQEAVLDTRAFKAYLTSFLALARSVTENVIQKEYAGNPNFRTWFDQKRTHFEQDPVMSFLQTVRNAAIKVQPIQLNRDVTIFVGECLRVSDSVELELTKANGEVQRFRSPELDKPPASNPEAKSETVWRFADKPEWRVFDICQHWLDELKKLNEECEKVFVAGGEGS